MKEIILTKGQVAIVDDEDYDWLNQWNWYANKSRKMFYANRKITINQKHYTISMHNEIAINRMNLEIPPGYTVDHKDRKGLHNWHSNLRAVTKSIQQLNRSFHSYNATGIRGICFYKYKNLEYKAYFSINSETEYEYFNTIEEAIAWRQSMEIKYYGKIIED